MAVTVTPPGTAAQPLSAPDHATWAGQVYNDLRSLDTAVTGGVVKVTHPNTDDVLVQAWDTGKARWQTAHYDSGWRNVSGLLINGWTVPGGWAYVRRVNTEVRYDFYLLTGGTTTRIFNLGAAFNPDMASQTMAPYNVTTDAAVRFSIGTSGPDCWAAVRSQQFIGTITCQTSAGVPASLPGTLGILPPV